MLGTRPVQGRAGALSVQSRHPLTWRSHREQTSKRGCSWAALLGLAGPCGPASLRPGALLLCCSLPSPPGDLPPAVPLRGHSWGRRVGFLSCSDRLKIFFRGSGSPAVNPKSPAPQRFFRPLDRPENVNSCFFCLLTRGEICAILFHAGLARDRVSGGRWQERLLRSCHPCTTKAGHESARLAFFSGPESA